MTDLSKLRVWIGSDGTQWAALSDRAPYFCFLAESEEAAVAKASAALRFYLTAPRKESREAKPFRLDRSVPAEELAA